ncbi:hypothetical protein ACFE04_025492 [Oxalis oulophora]
MRKNAAMEQFIIIWHNDSEGNETIFSGLHEKYSERHHCQDPCCSNRLTGGVVFVQAAQKINEVAPLKLESLAYYLAELALLEYRMLDYAPSLMTASTIFLARVLMSP